MAFEQPPVDYTKPLLSIVVTAYNVDGYIEEALESVLTQPYIDALRIIVVDDGSTDSTFAAVQAIVERDGGRHVQIIRQSNQGVSAARNAGIDAVRTPYVGFLDGDDIYRESFAREVVPLLADARWDMVEYNVEIIDDDSRKLEEIELVSASEGGECTLDPDAHLRFANRFHTFVWARVFRIDLFRDRQFPVGRHYEDMAIVPAIHLAAQNVYRVGKSLYGYRRRFGSITQRSAVSDMVDLRDIGLEALARCDGSASDKFWLTVFGKIFWRARHVCARVDRASFRRASDILRAMAGDYQAAVRSLAPRSDREVVELEAFDFAVRVDRSLHQVKGVAKMILRRRLDHHQRERRVDH